MPSVRWGQEKGEMDDEEKWKFFFFNLRIVPYSNSNGELFSGALVEH